MRSKLLFILIALISQEKAITAADSLPTVKDSIKQELREASDPQQRIELLDRLTRSKRSMDQDSLMKYARKGLELARTHKDSGSIADFQARVSQVHAHRSNYGKALQGFLDAIRIAEKRGDSTLMSFAYNGAGNVLRESGKPQKALKYHDKALQLRKARNDTLAIAGSYNNIGIAMMVQKKYDTGMAAWKKAVELKLAIGKKKSASSTLANMAMHYRHQKKYEKAKKHFRNALQLSKEHGDTFSIALNHTHLGRTLMNQKRYQKALEHMKKGLEMGRTTGSKRLMSTHYRFLARLTGRMGRFQDAYKYHKRFKAVEDSIHAQQKRKRVTEIEAKYQNEKKQLRIEKQNARLKAEQRKDYILLATLSFVFIFLLLILWNLYQKRKDNWIIFQEKQKVETQKELLEEKNEEIMDSIAYSQRLQEAILPSLDRFREALPGSFIFYQPKEAVAGDFYWLYRLEDRVLFAAADCTGHGIPGAMVSVVCHNALNRTIKEFGITEPARILEKTDELVQETFGQSEEEVKDGMDIVLCSFFPTSRMLRFAAANNPLYHIREQKEGDEKERRCIQMGERTLEELPPNKQAIGGKAEKAPFEEKGLKLEKGDSIYLFSDGFADQFGGPKGKKFKYKPFKRLLLEISDMPPEEQRDELEKRFARWRGELEQVDDVCVIGMKPDPL
ncbi:MAG: tetratricopeptide repeat protein [Flavobacteriales bacterium]